MSSQNNNSTEANSYENTLLSFLPDFYWYREWHAYKDGRLTVHGAAFIKNYNGGKLICLVNGLCASYQLVSGNPYLDDKFWYTNSEDRYSVIIDAPIAEGVSFVNVILCHGDVKFGEYYRYLFSIYLSDVPNKVAPPVLNIERVSGRGATTYNYFNNGATDFHRFISLAFNNNIIASNENCNVLDWGSGCARLTRHLLSILNGKKRVLGIDIDPDNTLWANNNISDGSFQVVDLYPPINFPDNNFDLIISNSVLSHLTEETLVQWLAEVDRLLKPGGLALLSYHGNFSLAGFCSRSETFVRKVLLDGINSDQRAAELDGLISDPEYYRQTFMTDENAAELFKRHLDYIDFVPGVVSRFQNVAICRKSSGVNSIINKYPISSIKSQIQVSSYTAYNRHPTIFSILRQEINTKKIKSPEILSFGCSTGEEVFTLDDLYIRNGKLDGVDISKDVIKIANSILAEREPSKCNNQIKFFSSSDLDLTTNKYDFVLALSVLCKWPELQFTDSSNAIYPFDLFCEQVSDLVRFVKIGGFLVIHNSNYYFEDSPAFARHFKRYRLEFKNLGDVLRFDLSERLQVEQRDGHVFFQRVK